MGLRIGLVTDIHCGPDMDTRLGSQALSLLQHFGETMQRFRPDLIIDLGDHINDVEPRGGPRAHPSGAEAAGGHRRAHPVRLRESRPDQHRPR